MFDENGMADKSWSRCILFRPSVRRDQFDFPWVNPGISGTSQTCRLFRKIINLGAAQKSGERGRTGPTSFLAIYAASSLVKPGIVKNRIKLVKRFNSAILISHVFASIGNLNCFCKFDVIYLNWRFKLKINFWKFEWLKKLAGLEIQVDMYKIAVEHFNWKI